MEITLENTDYRCYTLQIDFFENQQKKTIKVTCKWINDLYDEITKKIDEEIFSYNEFSSHFLEYIVQHEQFKNDWEKAEKLLKWLAQNGKALPKKNFENENLQKYVENVTSASAIP